MSAPAIRLALDLHSIPSRVRVVRSGPLPEEIELLLRVAVGEPAALASAASQTGRTPEVLRSATSFFIEQILLSPDADAYRMLGATKADGPALLRRHMALILRWMHPDLDTNAERSVFVKRVTSAWEILKSPERRAAYDLALTPRATRPHARFHPQRTRPDIALRGRWKSPPSAIDFGTEGDPNHQPGLLRIIALYLSSFRRT